VIGDLREHGWFNISTLMLTPLNESVCGSWLQELFEKSLALDPAERADFLSSLSTDNPVIAQQIRDLLVADEAYREHRTISAAPLIDDLIAPRSSARSETRIGAWRIVKPIGRGGMGEVFLVERADSTYKQLAALKRLHGTRTGDATTRFERERQALAELAHPNIARLLDGGHGEDNQPYLVLEYIEGEALLDAVATWTLPLRLQSFVKLCNAVHYAHQRLIIHRDLKPSNVLVRTNGEPVLLDFGIAKFIESTTLIPADETATQAFTPAYASPEQKAGRRVTTATDVYSLGMMLSDVTRDCTAATSSKNRELSLIIRRATADEADRRYPSALAFAEDINRFLQEKPVLAAPDSVLYRIRKFVGRNRLAVIASAFASALFAGLILQVLVERERAIEAKISAEKNARDATVQAKAASQSLEVLRTALESLAPNETAGGIVTVNALLDKTYEQIRSNNSDTPVDRSIAAVVGKLYFSTANLDRSQEALEFALGTAPPESTAQAKEQAEVLAVLSNIYGMQQKHTEARATIEKAYKLRQTWLADNPVELARGEAEVALRAKFRGDAQAAASGYERALSHLAGRTDANGLLANILVVAAEPKTAIGQAQKALTQLNQADVILKTLPKNERNRYELERLLSLGTVFQKLERLPEAEEVLRKAVAHAIEIFGQTHWETGASRTKLANFLFTQNRFREALTIEEENYEIELKERPNYPENLASTEMNLGYTHWFVGNFSSARRLLEKSYARVESGLDTSEARWPFILLLSRIAVSQGDLNRARELQTKHLARVQRTHPGDSEKINETRMRLAIIERRAGKCDSALALLLVAEGAPLLRQEHATLFDHNRAVCLDRAGHNREAIALLDNPKAEYPEKHVTRIDRALEEAEIRASGGDPKKARELIALATALSEQHFFAGSEGAKLTKQRAAQILASPTRR
jgi:eukaryotic-like serine/threonine-protein kinase